MGRPPAAASICGVEVLIAVQDVEVADRLKDAVAQTLEGLRNARQLSTISFGSRCPIPDRASVIVASPRAETRGARFECDPEELDS